MNLRQKGMERKLNEVLEKLNRVEKKLDHLYEHYERNHSSESDVRDFAINTLANIVGNAISTPTIINLNPLKR